MHFYYKSCTSRQQVPACLEFGLLYCLHSAHTLQQPEVTRNVGLDVQVGAGISGAAESLDAFWRRSADAWDQLQVEAHRDGGKTVAVVTHSPLISAMLCHCLGLGSTDLSLFRTGGGSITIIDFPDVAQAEGLAHGIVRCTNFTAHLGRWAVPVTRDDSVEYAVCGIDGCF